MVDEHMTESIKHLSPVYTHLTEIQPDRIEGIFLYDSAGWRYLDFSSGTGVFYPTSPQGADHTSGLTIRAKIDHLNPTIQVEASRRTQINAAGYNTLGVCAFAGFGFGAAPETIPKLLKTRYGWDVDSDKLKTLGRETLTLERRLNSLAGFTSAEDRIPVWMTKKKLPPHDAVFDVSEAEVDRVYNWESEI